MWKEKRTEQETPHTGRPKLCKATNRKNTTKCYQGLHTDVYFFLLASLQKCLFKNVFLNKAIHLKWLNIKDHENIKAT